MKFRGPESTPCRFAILGALTLGGFKFATAMWVVSGWVNKMTGRELCLVILMSLLFALPGVYWGGFFGLAAGRALIEMRELRYREARELISNAAGPGIALNLLTFVLVALALGSESIQLSDPYYVFVSIMFLFSPCLQASILMAIASRMIPASVEKSVQVTEDLRL